MPTAQANQSVYNSLQKAKNTSKPVQRLYRRGASAQAPAEAQENPFYRGRENSSQACRQKNRSSARDSSPIQGEEQRGYSSPESRVLFTSSSEPETQGKGQSRKASCVATRLSQKTRGSKTEQRQIASSPKRAKKDGSGISMSLFGEGQTRSGVPKRQGSEGGTDPRTVGLRSSGFCPLYGEPFPAGHELGQPRERRRNMADRSYRGSRTIQPQRSGATTQSPSLHQPTASLAWRSRQKDRRGQSQDQSQTTT